MDHNHNPATALGELVATHTRLTVAGHVEVAAELLATIDRMWGTTVTSGAALGVLAELAHRHPMAKRIVIGNL